MKVKIFLEFQSISILGSRSIHREPIDEQWKTGAAKELKGKDVDETLTWRTPEVDRWHCCLVNITLYQLHTIFKPLCECVSSLVKIAV